MAQVHTLVVTSDGNLPMTAVYVHANDVCQKHHMCNQECINIMFPPTASILDREIWRALNLEKWQKTALNYYWRNLNLAICTGV